MGPQPHSYPPWEHRPTFPTHHAYALPAATPSGSTDSASASYRPMLGFIVAIVGFVLAFGGTLVWRARVAHAEPALAAMLDEPAAADAARAPLEEPLPVDADPSPSAFEPPPPTIALTASVGEPPPPPPAAPAPSAKAEKRRKAKADIARPIHGSSPDSSAAPRHPRKARRATAD